jgi:hypothetical protein
MVCFDEFFAPQFPASYAKRQIFGGPDKVDRDSESKRKE